VKKLVAIIVGGTGQFGITLSKQLIKKNYKVIITSRTLKKKNINLTICKLNIYNKSQINKLLDKFTPNLIFYFAGQSSPSKSFSIPKETLKSNFLGCKNFLEILYRKKINCKFLNATSCEMYGKIKGKIKISSKKFPVNPYGYAKLKSYELVQKYRKEKKLKTYNAIIFNTESYLRNKDFLIPKICMAAILAKKNNQKTPFGNLNISREWNWCDEQSAMMLKFLYKKPQDFILSNGKNYSAIQMINFAFRYFKLDFNKYIVKSKKFIRKKDITSKFSDYKGCLIRNKISRKDSIYGKKLIIKLIKYYLSATQN
jgi:GDPmannose 4,6-dehydratase